MTTLLVDYIWHFDLFCGVMRLLQLEIIFVYKKGPYVQVFVEINPL